jgi:hypothetical protein
MDDGAVDLAHAANVFAGAAERGAHAGEVSRQPIALKLQFTCRKKMTGDRLQAPAREYAPCGPFAPCESRNHGSVSRLIHRLLVNSPRHSRQCSAGRGSAAASKCHRTRTLRRTRRQHHDLAAPLQIVRSRQDGGGHIYDDQVCSK